MMVVLGGVIYGLTSSSKGAGLNCSVTDEGAIFFRVVSDADGQPVQGALFSGSESYGCVGKQETWFAMGFAQQSGGWFSPVLPPGTAIAGNFSLLVQLSGRSYTYTASIAPLQVTCVTLRVPSGNFSSAKYSANGGLSQCLSH